MHNEPLDHDPRPEAILESLTQLVAGKLSTRPVPLGRADLLDQSIEQINLLADRLADRYAILDEYERRFEEFLDLISGMAALDFSRRAYVGDAGNVLDAMALGLNMLSEELEASLRKQAVAAQQLRDAQEQTIQAQAAAIAELSTPLIPISDTIFIMPLIGVVDSRRAQQVLESLLMGIARSSVQVVILDITGVSVVDTQVANAFIHMAQAVRLLGARVILTGIRPEVAQTLVGLGVSLDGITTRSSLQSGIAEAMRSVARN